SVPLETRLELMARIVDAVAAAHAAGVLHKDIKPSNILIHEELGQPLPRLIDFGIGGVTEPQKLHNKNITVTGFTFMTQSDSSSRGGTRLYSPPELMQGSAFTKASEMYSLGVLLYQMLVGDLTRPLGVGWERDIEDELLREDITRCV